MVDDVITFVGFANGDIIIEHAQDHVNKAMEFMEKYFTEYEYHVILRERLSRAVAHHSGGFYDLDEVRDLITPELSKDILSLSVVFHDLGKHYSTFQKPLRRIKPDGDHAEGLREPSFAGHEGISALVFLPILAKSLEIFFEGSTAACKPHDICRYVSWNLSGYASTSILLHHHSMVQRYDKVWKLTKDFLSKLARGCPLKHLIVGWPEFFVAMVKKYVSIKALRDAIANEIIDGVRLEDLNNSWRLLFARNTGSERSLWSYVGACSILYALEAVDNLAAQGIRKTSPPRVVWQTVSQVLSSRAVLRDSLKKLGV